jgi:hypothetical protein
MQANARAYEANAQVNRILVGYIFYTEHMNLRNA